MPGESTPPADSADPGGAPATEPADAGAAASPGAPATPLDPAAVTGPPWPRLVVADGAYTPPRLIRWPIVVGILLFAGWIAAAVALPAASTSAPSSASAYTLTANDAHFTAAFPSRPHRSQSATGTAPFIAYTAVVPDHAIAVTYFLVPAPGSFSLNGAINGIVSSVPGGKVDSRTSVTYLGQPAEDAVISIPGGSEQFRVVLFGSSGYIFEGLGKTVSSFAHDYTVLLGSFKLLQA
jgi:hypothetical protein